MKNFFSNFLMVILIVVLLSNFGVNYLTSYERGRDDGSNQAMEFLQGSTDSLNAALKQSRKLHYQRAYTLDSISKRLWSFSHNDKGLTLKFSSRPKGVYTYEYRISTQVIDSIERAAYLRGYKADSLRKPNYYNPFYKYVKESN